MARPLRIEFEGALYHITARGNRRERIFASDADRARFLEIIARSLRRFGVEVHAYVLLPNHFHFLVRKESQPEPLDALGHGDVHDLV